MPEFRIRGKAKEVREITVEGGKNVNWDLVVGAVVKKNQLEINLCAGLSAEDRTLPEEEEPA